MRAHELFSDSSAELELSDADKVDMLLTLTSEWLVIDLRDPGAGTFGSPFPL